MTDLRHGLRLTPSRTDLDELEPPLCPTGTVVCHSLLPAVISEATIDTGQQLVLYLYRKTLKMDLPLLRQSERPTFSHPNPAPVVSSSVCNRFWLLATHLLSEPMLDHLTLFLDLLPAF